MKIVTSGQNAVSVCFAYQSLRHQQNSATENTHPLDVILKML